MTDDDKLDLLWEQIDELLYDSEYAGRLLEATATRWRFLDVSANILIGATASGSAIAGWSLWSHSGWRTLWVLIAGGTSLLVIIHGALQVSNKVQHQERSAQSFRSVALMLESLRRAVVKGADFAHSDEEFRKIETKYNAAQEGAPVPSLTFRSLRSKVQEDLDASWSSGEEDPSSV